jgi:terminase small subunit
LKLNTSEAAIKAGYSKRTARSIGQENLTKPALNNYIILNQNILKNYNRHQLAK